MQRKLITLVGIGGPLLLLFICVAALILTGIAGWWFWSEDGRSQIVRIVSLAPLSTPDVAQPAAESSEQTRAESPVVGEAAPNLEAEANAQSAGTETQSITTEEIEETLGFAIPEGAVNSVTNVGLANRLIIPKLNVNAPIVLSPIENQTWKVDHLGQDAVGHLEGTAPAGSDSNVVLAGHITVSAGVYGPFAGLAQLAPGDVVFVYEAGQEFQYIVDGYQTVDRTAIEVTNPSETGQITLITCNNWDHNEGRYLERLIVKGHLVKG